MFRSMVYDLMKASFKSTNVLTRIVVFFGFFVLLYEVE